MHFGAISTDAYRIKASYSDAANAGLCCMLCMYMCFKLAASIHIVGNRCGSTRLSDGLNGKSGLGSMRCVYS